MDGWIGSDINLLPLSSGSGLCFIGSISSHSAGNGTRNQGDNHEAL